MPSETLAEALSRLPEPQREAVVLHYCQGWKLSEIGQHLRRTPAAVAGLLHRRQPYRHDAYG